MASFRESLLPSLQRVRNVLVDLGMRRFQVWTRVITFSGARVGLGTETVTDTYLGRVKARDVSSKDIIAGSSMNEQVYELGPWTPEHSGSQSTPDTLAVTADMLSPPQDGTTPTEIYFLLKGPGLPTNGILCTRVSDDLSRPFRYMVTVKNTGRKAT